MSAPDPLIPPALKPGDTIGVFAPSGFVEEKYIAAGKEAFESRGYKVFIHPQVGLRQNQFAGSRSEKLSAFHDLILRADIKAIVCAIGGNGALHLLDGVDYAAVATHPKTLMGFSDVTALLNAVNAKTGLITFHGPNFGSFLRIAPSFADLAFAVLEGRAQSVPLPGLRTLRPGAAQGRLMGGNLSMVQALAGTPFLPDMAGCILFIEDTNDHFSRYDRMLCHLRLSGVLGHLAGIVIGEFSNSQDNPARPFGQTVEEMVLTHTADSGIPVFAGAPFGHGENLPVFPIGLEVELDGPAFRPIRPPVRT